jgi:cytochrome c-type biogenesis protein CcmH/NrfG
MLELLFGWLFFLIAIAPTFPHYSHGNEYLVIGSERYLYLPCIGIFIMVAALWTWALNRARPSSVVRRIVIGISICVLLVLSYLTVLRTFVFEDSIVFNADILQKEPQDARTVYNFGLALEDDARPFDAEEAYKNVLLLRPDFADAAVNLGILFIKEGRSEDGLLMLQKAAAMQPEYYKPFFNLGVAEQNAGNFDAAISAYEQTLELFPDYPEALKNLASVYGKKKMYREAIATYEKLAAIDPVFAAQYEKVRGRMP